MGGAPHYCPGTREFMSASISLSICSRLQVAQQSGAMCTAASQWAACHEGFGMGDVPAQVFLGRQRVVTLVILIEVFHLRPVGRGGPASFVHNEIKKHRSLGPCVRMATQQKRRHARNSDACPHRTTRLVDMLRHNDRSNVLLASPVGSEKVHHFIVAHPLESSPALMSARGFHPGLVLLVPAARTTGPQA